MCIKANDSTTLNNKLMTQTYLVEGFLFTLTAGCALTNTRGVL